MKINKQTEIYEFLKSYTENKGYPPSIREICEKVSLSSTSTVHGHLQRLEKRGLIKRDPTKPRALEILELSEPKKEMIDVPIINEFKLGAPIITLENIEDTFPVPLDYIKHDNELFIVRVTDDSMINAGIRKNDLAILEETNNASNGEIILTSIYNCMIIKRYFKENDYIRLRTENDTMESLVLDECIVLGRLVGIFRSFE